MRFRIPRLYAIIDAAQIGERTPVAVAEVLLSAGVRLIQFRDKRASSRTLHETCREIQGRARKAGALFIVNDRPDVALTADADGVHVGQEDLPVELARQLLGATKLIGCSTHSSAQIVQANRTSADYFAFGPIFPTKSKERPDAVVGLEGLREARKTTRKPLVAIGGVTLENARAVIEAGADSVAVIRNLVAAEDPAVRVREFLKLLGDM